MTKTMRILAVAAATLVTAAGAPQAVANEPETDGLGPCQDAPFARLDRHPRLQEHHLDGNRVLVLLPEGLHPGRRYPVLYLLHGGISVPDEWVTRMNIEQLTATRDVIVVMPDGGRAGFYRDWASGGRAWETFHTERLVEWVDATFPTLADRSHRAVAGLSMGGGGAMYYAARHPDLFGAAGSFSGSPLAFMNTADHTVFAAYAHDMQQRCEADQAGVEPFGVYGNPITDETNVRDNMPEDLALALGNSLVYVSAGDGVPVDDEQRNLFVDHPDYAIVEALIRNQANRFTGTLTALGITHTYDQLPGSHWWATFRPGLTRFLDLLFAQGFGRPLPDAFDYRTARDHFRVWDWDVQLSDRPSRSFTTLRQASGAGFTIAGDGTATVTTAAHFRPRERLVATVAGHRMRLWADRNGRLTLALRVGPEPTHVRVERSNQSTS